MKIKSQKELAQEMVTGNVINHIESSLDFYAKEIGKLTANGGDPFIIEHCEHMYRAYSQLREGFNHFKFI